MTLYTVNKFNYWRYVVAQWDEIELCTSVVSKIRQKFSTSATFTQPPPPPYAVMGFKMFIFKFNKTTVLTENALIAQYSAEI